MKKLLLLLTLLSCLQSISIAQDSTEVSNSTTTDDYQIKTIFGNGHKSTGGFGAFMLSVADINGQEALLVGGRGGFVINHNMSFGIGGYGLTTPVYFDNLNNDYTLEMGYGGVYVEPTIGSRMPIHVSFPVLIGVGGAAIVDNDHVFGDDDYDNNDVLISEAFFIVEPGVNLEFNLTKFLRLGVGATYSYHDKLRSQLLDDALKNTWSYNFTMKIGRF